jgi:hypothetical protein
MFSGLKFLCFSNVPSGHGPRRIGLRIRSQPMNRYPIINCPSGTSAIPKGFPIITRRFIGERTSDNPEGISDNNPPIYRRGTEPGCTRHVRNGHRIIPKGFPIVTADLSAVTDRGYSLWKEPDLLFKNSQINLKKKAYFCRFNSD